MIFTNTKNKPTTKPKNMKTQLKITMAIAAMMITAQFSNVLGEDDANARAKKLAKAGPGVSRIEEKKGILQFCTIVGQAQIIDSGLGKASALTLAKRRAHLSARQKFTQWMKDNVTAVERDEESTKILMKGKQGEKPEVSQDRTIINENNVASEAAGIIRGMEIVAAGILGDEETFTVIMTWTPENASAAGGAQADNARGGKGKNTGRGAKDGLTKKQKDQIKKLELQDRITILKKKF